MDKYAHNNLNRVSISNFKSLKSVTLLDCRRINVFIGRPNVGKSNILEALALFDVPYMVNSSGKSGSSANVRGGLAENRLARYMKNL